MSDWDSLCPADCPVVRVEWVDITEYSQWNEDEDVQTTDVVTVGWLLEDSTQRVVVAGTYSYTDEKWASVVAFPKHPPEVFFLCPAINDVTITSSQGECENA